jgi:hypothetical protein
MEQERQIEGQMDVYDVLADAGASPDHPGLPDSRRREFLTPKKPMTKAERARRVVADRLKGEQGR